MILVLLLYALFASVFTIAKTGLMVTEPLFFIGTRMTLAGILMLAYEILKNPKTFVIPKNCIPKVFLLGLFNIYLTNAFEFWGLKFLTSSKTCFLYSFSPFLSALLCYFIFSEKLNLKKCLGLVVGFIGFLPILLHQSEAEESAGHFFYFSWPELAVIAATICSAYGWIVLRQLVSDHQLKPMVANGCSMLFGGMIALMHSYFSEQWSPVPVSNWSTFMECTLLLIAISNIICYNLYGHLLKKYTPTFMSFAGFTTPLFAALFGWLYLGEVVSSQFYLSGAIVLVGLIIFNQEELKQGVRLASN